MSLILYYILEQGPSSATWKEYEIGNWRIQHKVFPGSINFLSWPRSLLELMSSIHSLVIRGHECFNFTDFFKFCTECTFSRAYHFIKSDFYCSKWQSFIKIYYFGFIISVSYVRRLYAKLLFPHELHSRHHVPDVQTMQSVNESAG